MKRYKHFIDTHYDWSNESCQEKAFEQAYIVDEESPDGEWVRWEDVHELLKEARWYVDEHHSTYSYDLLDKIDEVLNNE